MLTKEEKKNLRIEVFQLLIKHHNISPQEISDKENILLDNWIADLENEGSHLLPQDVATNISILIKERI